MTSFTLTVGNNRWSDARLHAACAALRPGEWEAPRTGFFPSLSLTLHHINAVDRYHIDALTEGGLGRRGFREAPVLRTVQVLVLAQETLELQLIAFCRALPPDRATARVVTNRGATGRVSERIDRSLLHLHRGQAHAMLSATSVKPPQLDDFFLDWKRDAAALPFLSDQMRPMAKVG